MDRIIKMFSCGDLPELIGQELVLSGYLVIRGRGCFLVNESRYPFPESRVEVHCPGLEDSLDGVAGGWVGGVASYFDRVNIQGVLEASTTAGDLASISQISSLTLVRDGCEYRAIP